MRDNTLDIDVPSVVGTPQLDQNVSTGSGGRVSALISKSKICSKKYVRRRIELDIDHVLSLFNKKLRMRS